MGLLRQHQPTMFLILLLLFTSKGVSGAKFTLINNCDHTIWPGIYGSPYLDTTGFELKKGGSRSFQAPSGWSGRFWGRTGCRFDDSGHGSCATGDCGSGQIQCNGATATPPATLAEFTLGSSSAQDYYDVSLVDGYNLPMLVEVSGGSGSCATTGCVADLNSGCPKELKASDGAACRSACEAFGSPEYCCSGAYGSPSACKPSKYSQIFKAACPRSYSYAYDDATSTFTCSAADYTITFCSSRSGLKPLSSPISIGKGEDGMGSSPVEDVTFAATSWLSHIATGGSTMISQPCLPLIFGLILSTCFGFFLSYL